MRTISESMRILTRDFKEINYRIQDKPLPVTLPETNSSLLKIGLPKRKLVFQPSIFGCYVSFREGINGVKTPINGLISG